MNQDLHSSISIKSFMAEMHNDALFYLQEARNENETFKKWRFFRSAIIFFCISVEAAITQLVANQLKMKVSDLDETDLELLEKLTNPDKAEDIPSFEFSTFQKKIKVFERVYKQDIDQTTKSQMIKLTRFRNKIVHYTSSYEHQIYTQTEQEATNAPNIVDAFLSEIFKIAGLPDNGFQKNRTPNY
ncbi:hypothetical protein [Brevibacillus thermoruber]|jgi:hypothetical protein|uniref:hypothetical protein n=1 Tax=Brevibacillus thermoruber TaxID=33942 RepID=UPI0005512A9C|nr:hypothetical protein [Brevibacillus thermoruber]